MLSVGSRSSLALAALAWSLQASASLSIFEHGNGIKALGLGGVGYTAAEETTAVSANPAHALALGRRYDFGVDTIVSLATSAYEDNQAGPDRFFRNEGRRLFPIPQAGVTVPLSDRFALGFSVLSAGMGPDYPDSPYARVGSSRRSSLFLSQVAIVSAVAFRLAPDQDFGLSLNTSYQTLAVEGVEPFTALSSSPEHVTNQGKDNRFGIGYTLGWHGRVTPALTAGVAYRSKTWTGRHKGYEGLIPDGGRFELPAYYGAAIAYTPVPAWTLAFEFQRYEHASENALGNPLSRLADGRALGSKGGPGFGHDDQSAYKFGLAWQTTRRLRTRLGYVAATQIVQPEETLFNFLGAVTATTHYTAGTTYQYDKWEISGYGYHTPKQRVQGRNSIPPAMGGGEADVSFEGFGAGFSLGRGF